MLALLYDFIVILIFFIVFKFYGIYAATIAGIAGSAIQVIVTRLWQKKFNFQQLLILGIFVIFGGMTLYFHNPIFVKWKPTIVFWIFGTAFLINQIMGKQPFIQRMLKHAMEGKHTVPSPVWRRLNLVWMIFFFALGGINLAVAYTLSTNAWVDFKLYGVLGASLLFGFFQAWWLAKYLKN
jgi:intracellular septation protein